MLYVQHGFHRTVRKTLATKSEQTGEYFFSSRIQGTRTVRNPDRHSGMARRGEAVDSYFQSTLHAAAGWSAGKGGGGRFLLSELQEEP